MLKFEGRKLKRDVNYEYTLHFNVNFSNVYICESYLFDYSGKRSSSRVLHSRLQQWHLLDVLEIMFIIYQSGHVYHISHIDSNSDNADNVIYSNWVYRR